jgi:sugar lactone lactonase YvrE
MNDGVVDPAGRLFAGVMGFDGEEGQGALYRASTDGLERVLDAMTIPNGLGWSVDGSTMYVTDSGRQTIAAHDYDVASGELGPARPFVEIAGDGAPDGMCVDADGGVWTAVWGAGEVRRYSAAGVLDDVVTVPARQPSACCFAGADLDILVVTSATKDLSAPGELDGAVFAVRPGVRGRPLTLVDRDRLPR